MANAVRKEWPLLLVVDVLDMLAFDRGRTTLGADDAGERVLAEYAVSVFFRSGMKYLTPLQPRTYGAAAGARKCGI
jgi:hypothetical protein